MSEEGSPDLVRRVNELADTLLLRAEKNRLVSYLLHLLPGGEVLEGELFRRIREDRAARFELFRVELIQRLESLERDKIPYDYLDSEEFRYLFQEVAERVVRARRKEKIRRFAAVVKSAVAGRTELGVVEDYLLECIDRTEEAHLLLLFRLRQESHLVPAVHLDTLIRGQPSISLTRDEVLVLQSRLCDLNLINEVQLRGSELAQPVKLTSLGYRFLAFIETS